jgi:hypothetical protein
VKGDGNPAAIAMPSSGNYDDIERTNVVSFLLSRDPSLLAAKRERFVVPASFYVSVG